MKLINQILIELIFIVVFAFLFYVLAVTLYNRTTEQPKVNKTVQEASVLPENYEIRTIESPEFQKWKIKDRTLKKKFKHLTNADLTRILERG
ncbi:MAG: hypothetical protein GY941_23505 [Planctomycetes bacterium]|nr:hypothetical protein [Planctomycetota bacterium]